MAASCEENRLEESLEEQHRLVRCKVNGEDWRPRGDGTGGLAIQGNTPFDLLYYNDTKSFELSAGNHELSQGMRVFGRNTIVGVNEIYYNGNFTYFSDGSNSQDCIKYDSLNNSNNTFTILTLDSVNFIMTGEFEFQAINDCEDTVSVTEGYFDLHYRF